MQEFMTLLLVAKCNKNSGEIVLPEIWSNYRHGVELTQAATESFSQRTLIEPDSVLCCFC